VIALLLLVACESEPIQPQIASVRTTPPTTPAAPAPKDIDQAAFKNLVLSGKALQIVDVRTPEEYAAGHLAGSRNVPVDGIEARLGELEPLRAAPVYLVCETSNRAGYVGKLLSARGFEAVVVLGGMHAWRAAELPVVTGP
jgi:rhodanese-related sulfurtransferase